MDKQTKAHTAVKSYTLFLDPAFALMLSKQGFSKPVQLKYSNFLLAIKQCSELSGDLNLFPTSKPSDQLPEIIFSSFTILEIKGSIDKDFVRLQPSEMNANSR